MSWRWQGRELSSCRSCFEAHGLGLGLKQAEDRGQRAEEQSNNGMDAVVWRGVAWRGYWSKVEVEVEVVGGR